MSLHIGRKVDGRTILEAGPDIKMDIESSVFPALFDDGKYGIVVYNAWPYTSWESDNQHAQRAIEQSNLLPTVSLGGGEGAVNVQGEDGKGSYLVKMFFTTKKVQYGRMDELHR